MLGLFPNPGQNVYFITVPFFPSVSITNPVTHKTATVAVVGEGEYIQSAKLNGETYSKSWIGHEFFSEGGLLELKLGGEESIWGTAVGDRPPSLGVLS